MFEKLKELLTKQNLMQEALEESYTMLQIDKKMFDASIKSLRQLETSDVEIDIYQTDKKINRLEQEIRKKVLTHLAVSGTGNLGTGLGLVSIIIDVERIGDYTKNIYELARVHPKKLKAGQWDADLMNMEKIVSDNLGRLKDAFKESNKDMGRKIIQDMSHVKKKCDEYVLELIKGNDTLEKGNAVSLALYLRYLKRIAGHLQNVATSIVNPFHKIGYMEKKIHLPRAGTRTITTEAD